MSNIPSALPAGIAPTARCPQGIGLVFLDLDGTLLLDGSYVRPQVVSALRRAHELGVLLVVASGRPLAMIPAAVRELAVMDYYLCTNGAVIYDSGLQKIYERTLPTSLARDLVDALEPLGASWNAFRDGAGFSEIKNTTYMLANHSWLRPRSPRSLGRTVRRGVRLLLGREGMHQIRDIREAFTQDTCVEKLGCSFTSSTYARAAAQLLVDTGFEVAAVGQCELEITAPGVTKGSAARWLAHRAAIPRERAVAFGDSANDAPLAEAVGCLVAMGNADSTLKAIATCECGSVFADGVATWLEEQMS